MKSRISKNPCKCTEEHALSNAGGKDDAHQLLSPQTRFLLSYFRSTARLHDRDECRITSPQMTSSAIKAMIVWGMYGESLEMTASWSLAIISPT